MTVTAKKLDEKKVFKDPVHRYIHVDDQLIWALIGTKEFQRLRRIRQLGTSYLTFHGAEHSRFGHSLGVYEIVRRMIDVFAGHQGWHPEERLVALAAALLHDVGHGPFSHTFEKVFAVSHEQRTQGIILGDTDIHRVLCEVSEDFPQAVADVIAKTYHDQLVVSLISSQIDADRMDYLLRDAYYTGVSYGQFDLERILRVMRPSEHQAVIKHSGMHAVEDYIMSRYQMYWQVYFHPVTRSAEVILKKILQRAKDLYQQGYTFREVPYRILSLFQDDISLQEYLQLDEYVMLYYFQTWQDEADGVLRDLCDRFMNRRLFKYIDIEPESEQQWTQQLTPLFEEAAVLPDYYLAVDASSNLTYDLYRPSQGGENMPIQLLMPDGHLRELTTESEVVEAISGKKRTDHKLYFPEDELIDMSLYKETKKKILQRLGMCE